MNITNTLMFVTIVSLIIYAISSTAISYFLKQDKAEQFAAINGTEYRKNNGVFDFEQNIEKKTFIKLKEWLLQVNSGDNPKTYKKKIRYINHLENISCLILEKRGI